MTGEASRVILAALSSPSAFHTLLQTLRSKEWVVYSKPPFGGPEHVLKYLARYAHRVAISNGRLLSLDNGQVSFRGRDSRHNNRSGVMTLDAAEFIRRFLLHALPSGFFKIRISVSPPTTTVAGLWPSADSILVPTLRTATRSVDPVRSAIAASCMSSRA